MPKTRILFVEDSIILTLVNCEILREQGFDVVEVNNASAAFEVIDAHEPLSALMTDVDLGPGADGFEIARGARAAYPHLPVVFMSGTAAARHSSEGVGGSEFIAKPFHPQQMLAALDRAIHLEAA